MEYFGWLGFDCECGEKSRVPFEHGFGFGDDKNTVPSAIISIECTECKKRYNIKIEAWKG